MEKAVLGIDIGTTTISACVIGMQTGRQTAFCNTENMYKDTCNFPFAKEQNPQHIVEKLLSIADALIEKHPEICAIGMTGQMHGIVYTDCNGNAVSDLITWQDKRGNEQYSQGITYAQKITLATGYPVSSGYGLVSHLYNTKNGLVPKNAVSLCTIMDYAAMKLCNLKTPLMHASNAASLGLFDLKNRCFDRNAIEKLGMNTSILPNVTNDSVILGYYKNIPVSVAIGDNQASFLGSVEDEDETLLVNFGTGSQLSFVSSYRDTLDTSLELRPYIGKKYLVCGAALCGGRAYAILEGFFRSYLASTGLSDNKQYETMNRLALDELQNKDGNLPSVDTSFCGTRLNPSACASITKLVQENFTPSKIILGTLYGMVNELYGMYLSAGKPDFSKLAGSGNGIRNNEALKIVIENVFGKSLFVPDIAEEAACGAARFAKICLEGENI